MKQTNQQKKFTIGFAIIVAIFGAITAAAAWQLADREEVVNEPQTTGPGSE